MKDQIVKIKDISLKWLQKYCSLIIPNDDYADRIAIISRSRLIVFAIIAMMCALIARLFLILFFDTYKHKVYKNNKISHFKRLAITDRNGEILANSVETYDLYLQSSRIENIKLNIKKINKVLPNAIKDETKMFNKLMERKDDGRKVFIKGGVTFQQRQNLLDEDVEGMFFETNEKRFYTNMSTNSITGYCPSINHCISGIEKSMNSYLLTRENEPLRLSINLTVQNILHEILSRRILETKSKGAVGLIMKIKTGEIMAAVSLPDCDYNDYSSCLPEMLFNKYSYGVYELGSVMKIITVGLALQSGVSPYKQYERQSYKIDERHTIHDIDKKDEKGGRLNLIEMTKMSSNVGFAKLMEDIALKDQATFMSNLGLFERVRTEIPELGRPQYPKRWTFANGVTISYGHGIAITPLHYVTAVASLMKNSVVRPTFLALDESDSSDEYDYRYLDDDKYEILKHIMREVINSGGGRTAYIDRYDVGGKTGTAMQVNGGVYNRYSLVLSFLAVLPMNDPQYVFFLMLDRPQTDASNNNINRAATLLGKTMKYAVSTIGPVLQIKPISS